MSRRCIGFFVEGDHDAAVLGELLRGDGLAHVQKRQELEPFWGWTVPTFPKDGIITADRFRQIVPIYYQSSTVSVAIFQANGEGKLVDKAKEILQVEDQGTPPDAVAIFLDADEELPANRLGKLGTQWTAKGIPYPLPEHCSPQFGDPSAWRPLRQAPFPGAGPRAFAFAQALRRRPPRDLAALIRWLVTNLR